MAGPIQRAMSEAVTSASVATAVGKKMYDNERQASEKASEEAKATQEAKAKKQRNKKDKSQNWLVIP